MSTVFVPTCGEERALRIDRECGPKFIGEDEGENPNGWLLAVVGISAVVAIEINQRLVFRQSMAGRLG